MTGVNQWRNKALNAIIQSTKRGPIGLEVFMALTALRWAAFLVIPASVLTNSRSATMDMMATYVPTWMWALGFLLGAVWQAWAAIRHHYHLRILAAMAGVLWWSIVTAIDSMTGFNAATITLSLFAVAQVVVYMLLVVAYDEPEATI